MEVSNAFERLMFSNFDDLLVMVTAIRNYSQ